MTGTAVVLARVGAAAAVAEHSSKDGRVTEFNSITRTRFGLVVVCGAWGHRTTAWESKDPKPRSAELPFTLNP